MCVAAGEELSEGEAQVPHPVCTIDGAAGHLLVQHPCSAPTQG